jgi:stringent starvation protein B
MAAHLSSKRFYFFRAWYDWMVDNQLTPFIIVDALHPHVIVPKDHIQNDRITLNIAPQATNNFKLNQEGLEFEADFDPPVGIAFITIPLNAIVAIYAQENGQGTLFPEEEIETPSAHKKEAKPSKKRPELTIVE